MEPSEVTLFRDVYVCVPQEVDGTLIGEDVLTVLAGAESVDWYQKHGFQVFDAILFVPFQPLL